ncbi:Alpha/Beta hydrolase protein [Leptodontidium sp. MPI-SDFR-AT-0119]|nr:Alpha/Beta hydrolase protein [Leptodontidium sp. MPI-SDFR-AT-0119]
MFLKSNLFLAFFFSSLTLSPALADFSSHYSQGERHQKPLIEHASQEYVKGTYSLLEQNDTTCDTGCGHRQWSGTVDVTDRSRLFFWFFQSQNDPSNDPLILWMNGGPGGSSMMGLFTEVGPCFLTNDSMSTMPNNYSWNKNASMIFLEQPAGTGLSTLTPGTAYPATRQEGGTDFQTFLNVFFDHIFPDLAGLPLHIAGESFGGIYVPCYTNHILKSRRENHVDAFRGNITSIILVNAAIEMTATHLGEYELLCNSTTAIFNETTCNLMEELLPDCEFASGRCLETYDKEICMNAAIDCQLGIGRFYEEAKEAGLKSPYNIHKPCTNFPFCWDDEATNHTMFIRQPRVLRNLGYSADFYYQTVNLDLNSAWIESGDAMIPSARELSSVLDDSDIDVLVINGNDDYIVNTPGQKIVYDRLPWKEQGAYRVAKWRDWTCATDTGRERSGGERKEAGKLSFVTVDGAGHASPSDQPDSIQSVVLDWITRK